MTIDALPTAPNRNMTPEAFIAAADAFVAALNTMVSQANADLNLILNLSGLLATSTSSVLIGTGAKSFTVETGKAFLATQSVRAYSTASPTDYMLGTVTSYDAGTGALVLDVTSVGGSGTLAAWTVVLAASGEWLGNATTATHATTAGDIAGSPAFFSPIVNRGGNGVAFSGGTTYDTGPSVAQGTSGKWFASGTVTVADGTGARYFRAKLWDGTTVIAETSVNAASGYETPISLSGYIDSPAGDIRISVNNFSSATGVFLADKNVLTAIRIG